ncbi:hypothetical protein STEG23_029513 [Scotinomys teguina]
MCTPKPVHKAYGNNHQKSETTQCSSVDEKELATDAHTSQAIFPGLSTDPRQLAAISSFDPVGKQQTLGSWTPGGI